MSHIIVTIPVAKFESAPLASVAKYVNNQNPHAPEAGVNTKLVPDITLTHQVTSTIQVILKLPPNSVPLSISESLERTSIIMDTSRKVDPVSFTATGASFTQSIVTVPVAILDPEDQNTSINWKLKVSVPQKLAFGV